MGLRRCRGVRGTGLMIHQSARAGREGSREGRKQAAKAASLSKQADPWARVSVVEELSSRVGLKRPGMWTQLSCARVGTQWGRMIHPDTFQWMDRGSLEGSKCTGQPKRSDVLRSG